MIITRTPFRISFFGGGTDYPSWYNQNGGAVISASIDKYCYITCRYLPPFFKHKSRIVWSKIESVDRHEDIEHPAVREILNYMGMDVGVEIHHDADLPARSGLGSSSSFSVGLLHALHGLQGKMITKRELALQAIHVEQELLKENVGAQDQTAAAFGGFNKIEFGGSNKISVAPIMLSGDMLSALQGHLMLFFTGFSRTASEIAAEQVKNVSKNTAGLSVMREMVEKSIDILNGPTDSIREFGELLHESWLIKKSLASNISTSIIDDMYERAVCAGAIGGKVLGAGGGGFMLFFVPPKEHDRVRTALSDLLHVPFHFESIGSQIIYYAPPTNA